MSRSAVLALVALVLAGCSVPTRDASPDGQTNSCQQSSDCATSALCVPVTTNAAGPKACVASSASIPHLLFDVRPPALSSYGAGSSFLIDGAKLVNGVKLLDFPSPPNAAIADIKLVLEPVVHVTAAALSIDFAPACGEKGNIAADLEFSSRPKYRAIPSTLRAAKAKTDKSNESKIDLLPGTYDVYGIPKAITGKDNMGMDCTVTYPPVFVEKVPILADGTVHIGLAKPVQLSAKITFANVQSFMGWHLALFDRNQGHLVSEDSVVQTLGAVNELNVQLHFFYFAGSEPILRLSPPAGVAQPSVLWDASTFMVDDKGNLKASLTLDDFSLVPREVSGTIEGIDATPLNGHLRFKSKTFSGKVNNLSNNATYEVSLETNEKGVFDTQLLPGTYQVTVTPYDQAHAVLVDDIVIPPGATCFCAHLLTVPSRASVLGNVTTSKGDSLVGATVEGAPFLEPVSTYLARVLSPPSSPSRQSATETSQDGGFALGLDAGKFDLSVRPEARSHFPWFVSPRIAVNQTGDTSKLDRISLQDPAIVRGSVVDPSGRVIADAQVIAWLPLDADTLLQIGEATTSSEDGSFSLPLPATSLP